MAITKARVMTRPKANTLDPQGVVVKSNLEKIGIKHFKKVSIGRYIEIELDNASEDDIKEMFNKLLITMVVHASNTVLQKVSPKLP